MISDSLPKDAAHAAHNGAQPQAPTNGTHPDAHDAPFYRSSAVPNGAATPPKPKSLNIVFDNIPDELKQLDQWVLSRPTWNETKWDKPPLKPNGHRASSTSPATWSAFDTAQTAIKSGKFSYLGFVVTQQAGIVAVDLDGCIQLDTRSESADIEDAAGEIIARFNSYTEISPSGNGVRIFVRGVLPCNGRKAKAPWKKGGEKAEIEIGGNAKYFTVTGKHAAGTPLTIEEDQDAIDWLFSEYFDKPKPEVTPPTEYSRATLDFTDSEIVERARNAKNGGKFSALYNSATGGNDSEEDAALCCHLAFWTRDGGQIERIFNSSARGAREKWQERPDYRERTITAALEKVTEYYTPPREKTTGTPTSETPTEPATPKKRFALVSIDELLTRPDPTWLIHGVLQAATNSVLAAPHASFKSFLTLDMALHVATGRRWCGRDVIQGNVIYIAAEGAAGMKARVRAWCNDKALDTMPENFHFVEDAVQAHDGNDRAAFMEALGEIEPALIIFDTLSLCAIGLEENSSRDMNAFMAAVKSLQDSTGAHIMLVHHHSKAGGTRGSSAVPAATQAEFELKREKDTATLTCLKQKDGVEFKPMSFTARLVEFDTWRRKSSLVLDYTGTNDDAETITASDQRVYELLLDTFGANGASSSAWRTVANDEKVPRRTFYRALKNLVERGIVDDGKDGKGGRGAIYRPVELLEKLVPNDPEKTDQKTEALAPTLEADASNEK
jgi:predicted transcriptional regulator